MARSNLRLFLRTIITASIVLFLGTDAFLCRGDSLPKKLHDDSLQKMAVNGKSNCLAQDWIDVSLDYFNVNRGLPQCYPQDQRGEFLVVLWILCCLIVLIFLIAYLRCVELLKDNFKGMNFSLSSDGQLNQV